MAVREVWWALVLAAGLSAVPAQAKETVLNGVHFTLPQGNGWANEGKNGVILQKTWEVDKKADRDEKGAALLQVLPATSERSFTQNFQTALGIFPDLLDDDPIIHSEGRTINGYDIRMEHRCCGELKGVGISTTTVGIGGPEKQQFIVLVEMNLHGDDSRAAEADLAALVRSVRLSDDDKPFALVPEKGDGGLDGVYTTLTTSLLPNAFGGLDFNAESEILALDPGGLYSRVIPAGPIAEHCAAEPTDCGTYRLAGKGKLGNAGSIEMREVANPYGVIETSTAPLKQSGKTLSIDGADYRPVPPLDADTRFDGSWRYAFASSGSGAFTSGGISVERTLTLHKNGKFERTGAVGYMSSTETGGGTTSVAGSSNKPIENGTYKVEGYHLTLVAADGREEVLSLFEPDSDDAILVIDGDNYLKNDD